MTTYAERPKEMKTLKTLVALAVAATAIATVAGIWFWIADPAVGTTLYDTLGPVAAFSGIAAGVLFAGAAIWAQIKDLWQYIPSWVRVTVMTLVAIGLIRAIVSWAQA
ncbi:MAG: hypothetical protein QNJ77_02150 [Acidimicrobiia bacterium]|nr:hypothetical protein [Acidimicrobiia bacterium]